MIKANLTGKTALVTGGASGIGFAAARMFGLSGAKICINHLAGDASIDARIAELPSAQYLDWEPAGWWEHQDVYVVRKA